MSGDYFGVKVLWMIKLGKMMYSGFELFCLCELNCLMEVVEFVNKVEKIVVFAWELKGYCFVVIYGDGVCLDVFFYSMKDK